MTMTQRVQRLRELSLNTPATLSSERARLLTEYHKSVALRQAQDDNPGIQSIPVQRALALKYILEHKTIYIGDDELIVGEKGHAPKAAPTYPELCCHSLEDLQILDSREKIPFKVDAETRDLYEQEMIPYWTGRTMRERILESMTAEWLAAYEAGVFTEFMEQRSPGHTVLDNKIYDKGFIEFKVDIRRQEMILQDSDDPDRKAKCEQLKAMDLCCDALILYAERHAEKAQELAANELNPKRKAELEEIAVICQKVPSQAPETFREALQYYWFVHLGVTQELNPWDAFNPGHLDQHLLPFYEKGLAEGSLSKESARQLLQCLWVKFNNQPAPPKVGVTAAESSTYTDFAQINTGGIHPDGSNAVSEMTYLILDVIEEMRLLQPSSSIQVSRTNPDEFIHRAGEIIRTGFGQPSVFNTDTVVEEMLRVGKSLEDARAGGTSGCVETGAFGKENYNLTGYFNIPKVLEITLHNGLDPRTEKFIGIQTGAPETFGSFGELFTAFEKQLDHFLEIKIQGNRTIECLYAQYLPAPFLSILIDDCILQGKDYHDGGARYNTSYIQGVGLGTITDSLSALKHHVFDEQNLSMAEILEAIRADFVGHERLRQRLLNRTPKFGNDDDYADDVMLQVFEAYFRAIDGKPNMRGGTYHVNLLPTTCHVYFGSVMGASPDGRHARQPLSEGISPVQGADRHGPTAVIRSVAKMDHVRTGGTLLNQKFSPQILKGEGLDKLVKLIRTYFRLGGHHIQFNVIDADTLRAARANPELYRDLIVRVAGYSDYFCDLSTALQEEILQRTEHDCF